MSKYLRLSLTIVLLFISFLGCKKKEEPPKEKGIRLKSYTISGSLTFTYSYDSRGRVSRVVHTHLDEFVGEDIYTYDNDNLSEISSKLIDRTDGVLKLAIHQKYIRLSDTQFRRIEDVYMDLQYTPMDAEHSIDPKTGDIIKVVFHRGHSPEIYSVHTYTRDIRGNIVKRKFENYNNGAIYRTSETSVEFDDHPNPFYKLPDPIYFIVNTCPNNEISSLSKQPNEPDQFSQRQFVYNEQGYPVKRTITLPRSDYPITYTYESY